jgi:hypothetical protein
MSITTKDMTIKEVFSNTKYFIDFYQREYKWKRAHVINLLDDIFYRFELEYKPTIDPTEKNIDKYEWYYLNTFMTNSCFLQVEFPQFCKIFFLRGVGNFAGHAYIKHLKKYLKQRLGTVTGVVNLLDTATQRGA